MDEGSPPATVSDPLTKHSEKNVRTVDESWWGWLC